MIDVFNIPNSNQDISMFYSNGVSNSWQTWTKPRNCQWVWIMAIGAGGGGAGGRVATTTNGGSGGGGGAVTRAIFNASHLPDTLFILVGLGGAGGASGSNGSNGARSFVSILPNTTSTNGVLASGTNNLAGAGGIAAGNAVAGETAFTLSNAVFASLSTFDSRAGVNSDVSTLSPTNVTPLTSQITSAGAQGAGYNTTTPVARNGASIIASNLSPLISGGIGTIAASTNGGDGADGITSWKPFFSTGGAGGGNSQSGVGGNGGNGGIGCGGGAGGASGVTGGRGGRGGDGIVMIVSF